MRFAFVLFLILTTNLHGAPTSNRADYDISILAREEEWHPLKDFPDSGIQKDRDHIAELLIDIRARIIHEASDPTSRSIDLMLEIARKESLADKKSFKTEAFSRSELALYRTLHRKVRTWFQFCGDGEILKLLSPLTIRIRKRK